MDCYPDLVSEAELRRVELRLLGIGAGVPVREYGQTVTVGRTSAGLYTLTFAEYPGKYAGNTYGFDATTPAGLADYSCVVTAPAIPPASGGVAFSVTVYNAAGTATDLAAAQWLNLTLRFKAGSN